MPDVPPSEAATAVYNETHLLLKSQRACLAKYEQTPDRAKSIVLSIQALNGVGLAT